MSYAPLLNPPRRPTAARPPDRALAGLGFWDDIVDFGSDVVDTAGDIVSAPGKILGGVADEVIPGSGEWVSTVFTGLATGGVSMAAAKTGEKIISEEVIPALSDTPVVGDGLRMVRSAVNEAAVLVGLDDCNQMVADSCKGGCSKQEIDDRKNSCAAYQTKWLVAGAYVPGFPQAAHELQDQVNKVCKAKACNLTQAPLWPNQVVAPKPIVNDLIRQGIPDGVKALQAAREQVIRVQAAGILGASLAGQAQVAEAKKRLAAREGARQVGDAIVRQSLAEQAQERATRNAFLVFGAVVAAGVGYMAWQRKKQPKQPKQPKQSKRTKGTGR